MQSWPALARYGRFVVLGRTKRRTFLFDSATTAANTPIVLIHGLGDEADTWRHVFGPLAEHRRVIAIDLPGFGRSTAGGHVGLSACAELVGDVIDEVVGGPVVLAGSSLGAVVAELAAFRAPDRVRGLALIDGGLPTAGGTFGAVLRMLVPIVGERRYTALRSNHDAAYSSLTGYYADLAALPAADRGFLRQRVIDRVQSDTQRRAYFSLLRSMATWASLRGRLFTRGLASLQTPLLILWGGQDHIIPRRTADLIAAVARQAHIVEVPDAGHLPHQEQPSRVVSAVQELLAEV